MTKGTEIRCITDSDMLEIMRWIRSRGGECVCTDWEMRVIKVIRGTDNENKNALFGVDGVLGAVNTDNISSGEETEQT